MNVFLTSSAFTEDSSALNPQNGFTEQLKALIPGHSLRLLYITSDPDATEITELYAAVSRGAFAASGYRPDPFTILDRRNINEAARLIAEADLIFLSGGHVPTQNRFFQDMKLTELMRGFQGVVIGSSAGSMNAARRVYSQPELEGEAADPSYRRWLAGLGLTEINILPHLQLIREESVDGLRIFEDIAFPDSAGEMFYALPDGSFFHLNSDSATLYGEAYVIHDGVMSKICEEGDWAVV